MDNYILIKNFNKLDMSVKKRLGARLYTSSDQIFMTEHRALASVFPIPPKPTALIQYTWYMYIKGTNFFTKYTPPPLLIYIPFY